WALVRTRAGLSSERELGSQFEEAALQHVGRTLPRRRGGGGVCRTHRERPTAVEDVVHVEVHAQPIAAERDALAGAQIQLTQIVLAEVEAFTNQLNRARCCAGPV